MSYTKLEQDIIAIVANQLNLDSSDVNLDTKLADGLNADSLDFVEIILEIEDKVVYHEFDESELDNVKCVRDIVDHITKNKIKLR